MVRFVKKSISCEEALDLPRPTCAPKRTVFVVAAALIDADGRVLMAQRPEGKSMAGLWEFPGGKMEQGETPEFALMREIEEELGVETRPCCYTPIGMASHGYDDFHLIMPLYACRVWRGEPQMHEHAGLKWMFPHEMYALPMPEADLPLIPQLETYLGRG